MRHKWYFYGRFNFRVKHNGNCENVTKNKYILCIKSHTQIQSCNWDVANKLKIAKSTESHYEKVAIT